MGCTLILLGLAALGVAFTALTRGQVGWFRKAAVAGMIAGVLGSSVGCAATPGPRARTAADSPTSTARAAPSPIPTTATTAPSTRAKPSGRKRAAGGGNDASAPAHSRMWNALAECESSGDWAINTGNGLYGGLQLDRRTWLHYGGPAYAPLPHKATREEQIRIAEKVRADQGFSPWSSCARKLGLL